MLKQTMSVVAVAVVVLALSVPAQAVIVTVPAGLSVGDEYRLVFPTSTEIAGRPSAGGPTHISGYNTFATNTATAVPELNALATTWTGVVSTRTLNPTTYISAKSNTGTDPVADGAGVPIYNLAGELVASNNADLWDNDIANAIDVTELGTAPPDQPGGHKLVWTGTSRTGVGSNDSSLISQTGGWYFYGNTALSTSNTAFPFKSWIGSLGGESGWDGNAQQNSLMPIYAMSGTLTVQDSGGGAIPEPATMCALGMALAGLGGYIRRRRKA